MLVSFLPPPIPRRLRHDDAASRLHAAWIWLAWHRSGWAERCLFLLAIAAWPFYLALSILLDVGRLGSRVRRDWGTSHGRQFLDLLSLGLRHHLPPRHYYMFELYRHAADTRVHEYLHRAETKSFLFVALIDRSKRASHRPPFVNKPYFAKLCVMNRLAVVPTLAVVQHGKLAFAEGAASLPAMDLFLKPSTLRGGTGAEIWSHELGRYHRHLPAGTSRRDVGTAIAALAMRPSLGLAGALLARLRRAQVAGEALDATAMCRYIEGLPPQLDYLVQPRLVAHPALADLSFGTLTTVRVITCASLDGEVDVTHAVFRMPVIRDAVVDNFHAGGIAAAIDVETGCLACATDMGLHRTSAWHAHHPLNGAPIEGRVLPWWREVGNLAHKAHLALADRPIVGWDIAILEGGPCLIEGNGRPDLDLIQRPYRRPLGNARLGQILAAHIDRKLGGLRPSPIAHRHVSVGH